MDVPATEFKAKCLAYLDQVEQTHASITLTKHGRAVAKLVPIDDAEPAVLGRLADATSIEFVYQVSAFLPLIGLLIALLPRLDHHVEVRRR